MIRSLARLVAPFACAGAVLAAVLLLVSCFEMTKSELAAVHCGELEWVVSGGGDHLGDSLGDSINAVDSLTSGGHLVVAGQFVGTAVFGAGSPGQTEITSLGSHDAFVARYSPGGELAWVAHSGATIWCDHTTAVATGPDDSILVVGDFIGPAATFGIGSPDETDIEGFGTNDVFVLLYDSSGNLDWVTYAGGTGSDSGYGAAVGPASAPYLVTGFFSGSATFGPQDAEPTTLDSGAAGQSMFVAAYSTDGSLVWAVQAEGESEGLNIAANGGASIWVTGSFEEDAVFGPGEDASPSSAGGRDVFVAKYDAQDGALAWVSTAGGPGNDIGVSLALLQDGSVLVTGTFEENATFGLGEDEEAMLSSAGASDVFISLLDQAGKVRWVRQIGGTNLDSAGDITALGDGSFVVVGWFMGTADFDPDDSQEDTLESVGMNDTFIGHFDSDGELICIRQEGNYLDDAAYSIVSPVEDSIIVAGSFNGTMTFAQAETHETTLTSAGESDFYLMRLSID